MEALAAVLAGKAPAAGRSPVTVRPAAVGLRRLSAALIASAQPEADRTHKSERAEAVARAPGPDPLGPVGDHGRVHGRDSAEGRNLTARSAALRRVRRACGHPARHPALSVATTTAAHPGRGPRDGRGAGPRARDRGLGARLGARPARPGLAVARAGAGAFAAVPRLRRHWRVRGYVAVPVGWSWAVAAVVCGFTAYLAAVFLDRNPIVPTSERTLQYLDLSYQLSLAGEAKHAFPPGVPQVAGEPLYYHWFGHAHMAMTSLVGHIDLPVVAMRLAIPALCALAVSSPRSSVGGCASRPYVGAVAAALFFAVGEFNFTHPVTMPFGTQATFVIWHGMSMIYSWVLLIAVIAPLADWSIGTALLSPPALLRPGNGPQYGKGGSDRPDRDAGAGARAGPRAVRCRSIGADAGRHGGRAADLAPADPLERRRGRPHHRRGAAVRDGGALPLPDLRRRRWAALRPALSLYWGGAEPVGGSWWRASGSRSSSACCCAPRASFPWYGCAAAWGWSPAQWLLRLGRRRRDAALPRAEPAPGSGNQYFIRTGFSFGVIASAWGYALLLERPRLSVQGRWALGLGTLVLTLLCVAAQFTFAGPWLRPPATRAAPAVGRDSGRDRRCRRPGLVGRPGAGGRSCAGGAAWSRSLWCWSRESRVWS